MSLDDELIAEPSVKINRESFLVLFLLTIKEGQWWLNKPEKYEAVDSLQGVHSDVEKAVG